jgi:hypothetical protein
MWIARPGPEVLAEILAKELFPYFSMRDLINLPNYSIYLKLILDGVVSPPFSGEASLQRFNHRQNKP